MTSLSIFFEVQFWVYLAAVVFGPATCFNDGSDDDGGYKNFNFDVSQQWKNIKDPSWWSASKTFQGDQKENKKTKAVVLPSTVPSRQFFDITNGFFDTRDRRHPKNKKIPVTTRHHVTNRPKDEKNATVSVGVPTATTAISSHRAVFETEDKCVSANNGRPCMCYMTDFLNSIGKRLDEATADDQTSVATTFRCPSYKPVPTSFVVFPTANTTTTPIDGTIIAVNVLVQNHSTNASENGTADVPERREVNFDHVVNYQLETSKDDHYAEHYGLIGSDVKLSCLINSDGNNTEIKTYKWDYTKPKNRTNSTITGTNMNNLLILDLKPRDSKNYTCLPNMGTVRNSINDKPYTHYVIAVENPIYEIHGTAYYKTINSGDCTPETISYVRKNLPNSIRSEMCPEGSSRYACNVDVETAKCLEEEVGTLEIKYLVTLNEKASYLTRIKTSKKGQDALYHQKLLARISNVLVENLNKSLTVQITLQMSPIYSHFDPDYGRTKINKYVSCSPGFGIREVFCAACPPHHYSPDKRADCLKCPKGFHQLNAGSKMCVKCPSIYSSGCHMSGVPYIIYCASGFVFVCVALVVVASCWCCCRDENETNIKILPRGIRKKLKRTKEYRLYSTDESSTLSDRLKNLIKTRKKSKKRNSNSKIRFKNIHNEFNQDIQIP